MRTILFRVVPLITAMSLPTVTLATDVGVNARSLSIKSNTNSGAQRLKSVQKDPLIHFGPAAAPAQLSGQLEVFYVDTPSNKGTLPMPSPWYATNATTVKYKNTLAPAGPSLVKTARIKNAKVATVSTKGLGGLNITTLPGAGGIVTVFTLNNAVDSSTHRFCTLYATANGSTIKHRASAGSYTLIARRGVPTACPNGGGGGNCTNGITDGVETDIDCGGGTCPACGPGSACGSFTDCDSQVCTGNICQAPSCNDGIKNGTESGTDCGGTCLGCATGGPCNAGSDCQSGVCAGNVCQAPTCVDAVENGTETDVDCGGGTCGDCAIAKKCTAASDCLSNFCSSGHCRCPSQAFTFTISSNNGGSTDSAEWPGGTSTQNGPTGCSVTINQPSTNIDLVGNLGDHFGVNSQTGYSACVGTGGEDGDGCQPLTCPPAGIGSCESGRPSCSAALNGSGSARYFVQCNQ